MWNGLFAVWRRASELEQAARAHAAPKDPTINNRSATSKRTSAGVGSDRPRYLKQQKLTECVESTRGCQSGETGI